MNVTIGLAGGSPEALADLAEWLSDESELRGRVRVIDRHVSDTELGSVAELLTVALGAGGAGTVLASSVITWLQTRRTVAKIIVESSKGSVTLDIQTVADVTPLLERIRVPTMTSETDTFGSSRAVLIGVSAYEYGEFPPIRAARNSVEGMRAVLADKALCGWPSDRITVISNPVSAVDVAIQLADLAETATGVFLLYFVGHGVLSQRGELCLTVTSTRPDRPKITGLAWDTMADVLRVCPARFRIAILDCCFAGRAIEALSGDSGPGLADITHVQGICTITATTRNRTAHVSPPDQQDSACTSFTGELLDLIRSGIPDKPNCLTVGDIYPVLRKRLVAKGLPAPNQRGTDMAHLFPFTANASAGRNADGGVSGTHGSDPAGNGDSGTHGSEQIIEFPDYARAAGLVDEALRAAHLISAVPIRLQIHARAAKLLHSVDPDRASRLVADMELSPA